jgi:hypothetical protein
LPDAYITKNTSATRKTRRRFEFEREQNTYLGSTLDKVLALRGGGFSLERGISDHGHISTGNVHLGGGGDNIHLIDTTQRHTVNLVRACIAESEAAHQNAEQQKDVW